MTGSTTARVLGLALALGGCATAAPRPSAAPRRNLDTAPERVAGVREAAKVGAPEAAEERFGTEEARARRDEEAARRDERQRRVDVIEGDKKKPPPK
jgi:hypothetical protein